MHIRLCVAQSLNVLPLPPAEGATTAQPLSLTSEKMNNAARLQNKHQYFVTAHQQYSPPEVVKQ